MHPLRIHHVILRIFFTDLLISAKHINEPNSSVNKFVAETKDVVPSPKTVTKMEGHLGALVNDDLVREIALLAWLNKSETGEDMFRLITGSVRSKGL